MARVVDAVVAVAGAERGYRRGGGLGANTTRGLGGRTGRLIIRGDVRRLRLLAAEVGCHGTQLRRGEGPDRDS